MGARTTGSSHGRTERAVGTAEKASLWSRAPPLHVRVRTMPILCRELYSSMQPSCICKNSQRVCRMQIVCDGPHSVPQSGQRFSRVRPFAAQVGHKWPVVPRRPRLSIPIPAAGEAEDRYSLSRRACYRAIVAQAWYRAMVAKTPEERAGPHRIGARGEASAH